MGFVGGRGGLFLLNAMPSAGKSSGWELPGKGSPLPTSKGQSAFSIGSFPFSLRNLPSQPGLLASTVLSLQTHSASNGTIFYHLNILQSLLWNNVVLSLPKVSLQDSRDFIQQSSCPLSWECLGAKGSHQTLQSGQFQGPKHHWRSCFP